MALTDEYPGRPKEPDHGELGNMSLWEHLSELRKRLIIVVIAVVVGAVVSWFFYGHIVEFMLRPYHHFLSAHEQKNISNGQLVISGPLEGFTTRLKVSVYAGLAVASPVIFWQLWRFITPGLHKNEKRYVLPFVSGAVVLFAIGVTTAVLIFPKALTWLIDVSGPGVVPAVLSVSLLHPVYRHVRDLRGRVHVSAGGGLSGAGGRGAERHLATMAAAGHCHHLPGRGGDHPEQRSLFLHSHGDTDADLLRGVDPHRSSLAQVAPVAPAPDRPP